MCVVSLVIDQLTAPRSPNFVPWTQTHPLPATAEQMLRVIELLERIDKQLGMRDCAVEAKSKAAFKRKLRRRAAKRKP